jgi:hypothetical protein
MHDKGQMLLYATAKLAEARFVRQQQFAAPCIDTT